MDPHDLPPSYEDAVKDSSSSQIPQAPFSSYYVASSPYSPPLSAGRQPSAATLATISRPGNQPPRVVIHFREETATPMASRSSSSSSPSSSSSDCYPYRIYFIFAFVFILIVIMIFVLFTS